MAVIQLTPINPTGNAFLIDDSQIISVTGINAGADSSVVFYDYGAILSVVDVDEAPATIASTSGVIFSVTAYVSGSSGATFTRYINASRCSPIISNLGTYRQIKYWSEGADPKLINVTDSLSTLQTAINVSSSDFVTIAGTQTVSGAKTFSAVTVFSNTTDSTSGSTGGLYTLGGLGVTKDIYSAAGITAATQMRVSATTNQIRLGAIGANDTIISSTAPAADRVYTIPDAGGNVEFVMAGGTQSIAGAKTFTTAPLFQNRVVNQSADGAITPSASNITYYVTKAGVCAMTIADPTATTHDGARLTFISTTAQAHTLSNAAGAGFNGGGAGADIGTFGGAVGDNIVIEAYQGVWYVVSNVNVTLA